MQGGCRGCPLQIVIEYSALRHRGGFVPVYREAGEPWAWLRVVPIDLDLAITEAQGVAAEAASRFCGDYRVNVVRV